MKTLIASVALATVIASPVLAQTTVRRAPPAQQNVQQLNRAPTPNDIQWRSLDPNAVYQGNQYLGSDPDPNVRLLLRLDAEHRD